MALRRLRQPVLRARRCDIAVDHVLQLLAGLEERNLLGGNFDAVAGLGVASHARLALPGAEAAEAADLNLVARAQRAHHALKDCFDNDFAVLAGQFRQAGHFVDQICLGHCCSPLARPVQPAQLGYSQISCNVGKSKLLLHFRAT